VISDDQLVTTVVLCPEPGVGTTIITTICQSLSVVARRHG
jgi:hypothetical protein